MIPPRAFWDCCSRPVGLPYFLLASTSPLVQSWFARTVGPSPIPSVSLFNLGSLISLLAYPVIVEPELSTRSQMVWWSLGYAGFVVICAIAGLISRSGEPIPETHFTFDSVFWTWLGLAACPSVLWLAVANHLSQDVAPVPFLWVLPLSLYLLSFVFASIAKAGIALDYSAGYCRWRGWR